MSNNKITIDSIVRMIFLKNNKVIFELSEEAKKQRTQIHKEIRKGNELWSEHSKLLISFGAAQALLNLLDEVDKQILPEKIFVILKKDEILSNILKIIANKAITLDEIIEIIGGEKASLAGKVNELFALSLVDRLNEGTTKRYHLTLFGESVMQELQTR